MIIAKPCCGSCAYWDTMFTLGKCKAHRSIYNHCENYEPRIPIKLHDPLKQEMLKCLISLYKTLTHFGSNISKCGSKEIIEKVTGKNIEEAIK